MAPSLRIKLDLPDEVRRFTNAELQAATRQMSKNLMLGMGGFGPVFRLVDKEEGKCAKVGIGIASKKDCGVGQGKEEFANEAKLLHYWQHPRIVKLMGVCEGPVPCIIYEHMTRGSLQALMANDAQAAAFPANKRLQAAIDVAEALDFLHTGGRGQNPRNSRVSHAVVIHRDLNPSNVLLDSEYRAKVGDFGLSAMLHEGDIQPDMVFSCEQVVGQWAWSAPEAQTTGNMPASDVFALGLIVFQLIFGCEDANACRQSFIRGDSSKMVPDKRLPKDSEWQEAIVEPLVELCLEATREEPATRPRADECRQMLLRILEMATGCLPPEPEPLEAWQGERKEPLPLAVRAAAAAAASGGEEPAKGPGTLIRIAGALTTQGPRPGAEAGARVGDEEVASVVAVACCDEREAREALALCSGDVNAAVDVLVSGRLDEMRRQTGAGPRSRREGGRGEQLGARGSEPGRVYLPSGLGTGSGTVNFTDGSKYEGHWVDGTCNGIGSYMNAQGTYTGEFRNSLMHGNGRHFWTASGLEYQGEWQNGQMHGRGILTRIGPPAQRFEIISDRGKLISQKHLPEGSGGGQGRMAGGERIAPNQEEKDFMKESFISVAACTDREALDALCMTGWDLQAALKAFMSGDPDRVLFDGLPVAAGGGDSASARAAQRGDREDRAGVSHVSPGGAADERTDSGRISVRGGSTAAQASGEASAAGGSSVVAAAEEMELPEGWERRWDAGAGRHYYANHKARTTQWNPPSLDIPPTSSTMLQASAQKAATASGGASGDASWHGATTNSDPGAGTKMKGEAGSHAETAAHHEAQGREEEYVQSCGGGGGAGGAAGEAGDGNAHDFPWAGGSRPLNLEELLGRLSLGKIHNILMEQEIRDLETVSELEEIDFVEMGVALEDARTLMTATQALRVL